MLAIVRLTLVALALFAARGGDAACTTKRCTSQELVDATRALVADACDCAGTSSHGKYLKCAKQVVKQAVASQTLPAHCKGAVLGCEGQSTCGRRGAAVCCVTGPRGQVKSKLIRSSQKCPGSGTLCQGPVALVDACTTGGTCAASRRAVRSFRSVQQVFSASCALPSCHSTFARQGGLVLDSEDVSYRNLVGRAATLPEASGLTRVVPGDPDASFLIRKLRGEGPGLPMPETGGTLASPIINMISAWIARGALTSDEECDQHPGACDDDGTIGGDYHWQPLPALDPPAADEGIQLHMPPRPVDAGQEWEMCYAFRPNWDELAARLGYPEGGLPSIKQQVYRMHPGSHHLLLYAYFGPHPEAFPDGYYPCSAANCINATDCPPDADNFTIPIGGTQVAGTRYEVDYPEGVGIPLLSRNMVVIANPHYTNPFLPQQDIYGEAWLNLSFYKPGEFKALLDGIFAINARDLLVEPYETRTISQIWKPRGLLSSGDVDAAVFQLFGHFHKRGTEFTIDFIKGGTCSVSGGVCGRDSDCECKPSQNSCVAGQTCIRGPGAEDTTIYNTHYWDEAPIMDFPKPYFPVNRDEGLRWTCTHTNGVLGDETRPPKRCHENCAVCGWDPPSRTCKFCRTLANPFNSWSVDGQTCVNRSGPIPDAPRVYNEGDPMPLVFGLLADDDMCNMFGYFINQDSLANLP